MTTPLHRAKASVRLEVRSRLNAMSETQRETASSGICSRLRQQLIWQSAGSLLFFAPLPGEPDVWPLLQEALRSGRTVALPRFSAPTKNYEACVVRDLAADLVIGQFGIREPAIGCAELPLNRLDLALVPGVAFDQDGRRLGRGRGFFDRLLANIRGTKCGIAFDEQLVDAVPVGPLDVGLNCILTPTRWIET